MNNKITIKERLARGEKKLLSKINSGSIYKWIIGVIFLWIPLKKKFFIFGDNKKSKKKAVVSVTSDNILGTKVSYIDDFIVDKKLRGKGIGGKLFGHLLEHIDNDEQSDYVILVSENSRKASHGLYKKFGFQLISLGIGYFAYKKLNKNKCYDK